MQVNFVLRQFDASDDLRALIQGKIDKRLDNLVDKTADARVTLSLEKAWTVMEVVVTTHGEVFKSAEKTTDLYPTIDVVIEKIERQLHKKKDMVHDRRTGRA
jgi:putative sigma-54 modulation protein